MLIFTLSEVAVWFPTVEEDEILQNQPEYVIRET